LSEHKPQILPTQLFESRPVTLKYLGPMGPIYRMREHEELLPPRPPQFSSLRSPSPTKPKQIRRGEAAAPEEGEAGGVRRNKRRQQRWIRTQ
jgi:hypothetical protein